MAYKFFNYAQAMKDKNEIESGKLKNALQGLTNEEARIKVENLQKAREIRDLHKNAPARIQAFKDAGMLEQANTLIQEELKTLSTGVTVAGQMRNGLNADNWKATRQQLIEKGAFEGDFMPVEYDDKWLRDREKEAKTDLKKITAFVEEDGERGFQDTLYKDGEVESRGPIYSAQEKSTRAGTKGGSGGLNASMSNSIGRHVAQLFDSIYDPGTGEISITDPEQRPKVLAIKADAEQLVRDEGMTPAAAVEKASKQYGIKRPGADVNNVMQYVNKPPQ